MKIPQQFLLIVLGVIIAWSISYLSGEMVFQKLLPLVQVKRAAEVKPQPTRAIPKVRPAIDLEARVAKCPRYDKKLNGIDQRIEQLRVAVDDVPRGISKAQLQEALRAVLKGRACITYDELREHLMEY